MGHNEKRVEEIVANRKRWVTALRSGRYTQGRHAFEMQFGREGRCYCPLGVLLAELSREVRTGDGNPAAITFAEMIAIMHKSDVLDESFHQIANYIEFLPIPVDGNKCAADVLIERALNHATRPEKSPTFRLGGRGETRERGIGRITLEQWFERYGTGSRVG